MNDRGTDPNAVFADLEPFGYGAEGETPVIVHGLLLALPLLVAAGLLVGWAWRHLRARRAAAVEAGAATTTLRPGPAVVSGVVEGDPGVAVVEVTIEQLGVEHKSKSSWHTTWTETDRRTVASPFAIRLADGARLQVRPGDDPRLVDDLAPWSMVEADRRCATAALVGGERVVARGVLSLASDPSAGYRGGEALVLGAPAGGRLELSTRGLARPERERAARFVPWVAALLAATVVAQLLALPYHVARALGETRLATVVERRTTPASSKKRARHFVTYRVPPDGELVVDEVDDEDHARLREGTVVPVRVSPLETTIGPHPTLDGGFVLPSSLVILVLCVAAPVASFRRRAWYERKLVETVTGRLGGGS